MSSRLWFHTTDQPDVGPRPVTALSPQNLAAWEAGLRFAVDVQGPRIINAWEQYRDTDFFPGAAASSFNMWDGLRSFIQAYLYFGQTDSDYLDYAAACANFYYKWMEQGGLQSINPANFYRPQTFFWYPDGITSLWLLDPGFNGGANDPGYWGSGTYVANNIPEFCELVVQNCQYGERQAGGSIDFSRERFSREAALTSMYYLNSLRCGNAPPTSGRFDQLVVDMKNHMNDWLNRGPELLGVNSLDFAALYNYDGTGISNGQLVDPGLVNQATWMLTLTAEAMIRTYREHPNYQGDRELIDPIYTLGDWLITYGREPERVGTYWSRYVECHDCNDPIVQAANSPFSPVCVENANKQCWHISVPYSQNPSLPGDKAYEILTPMVWAPFVWLVENDKANTKWIVELDDVWNKLIEFYDMGGHAAFIPKQFGQIFRFWFDVVRVRQNSNIHTTFDFGPIV